MAKGTALDPKYYDDFVEALREHSLPFTPSAGVVILKTLRTWRCSSRVTDHHLSRDSTLPSMAD